MLTVYGGESNTSNGGWNWQSTIDAMSQTRRKLNVDAAEQYALANRVQDARDLVRRLV